MSLQCRLIKLLLDQLNRTWSYHYLSSKPTERLRVIYNRKDEHQHTDYTVKEGATQVPVILIIQESDHVGQQHVIGFLTPEEDAQTCDPVLH